MAHPLTSHRRAARFSSALFFIGLAIIALFQTWWPWIMLVVGIPLALRQCLLGRTYDMMLTLLIYLGIFIESEFDITWELLLPVLFGFAALYILIREFQESREHPEDEDEEDLNHELEEDTTDTTKPKK